MFYQLKFYWGNQKEIWQHNIVIYFRVLCKGHRAEIVEFKFSENMKKGGGAQLQKTSWLVTLFKY